MGWIKNFINQNGIVIGDVFCIETGDCFKYFFQYIGNDNPENSSEIIRVFSTRYPIIASPDIQHIVRDKIMCYAHTDIRKGIKMGVWKKVGYSEEGSVLEILFAEMCNTVYVATNPPTEVRDVEKLRYWAIWKCGGPHTILERKALPPINKLSLGYNYDPADIIERVRLGYFKRNTEEYGLLKRIPHPHTDSYTTQKDMNLQYFFHFRGEEIVREIVVGNGKGTCLSQERNEDGLFKLLGFKFWEINWEERDFVSKEEFEELWDRNHINIR